METEKEVIPMPLKLPRFKLPTLNMKRIATGSDPRNLPEALAMDAFDWIPVIGDVGNAFRIKSASQMQDPVASRLQIADTVAGTVFDVLPGGEIISQMADIISPTNTIVFLRSGKLKPPKSLPRPPRVPAPPRLRVPRLKLPRLHIGK